MFKRFFVILLSCFLYITPAKAYEFAELNTLWDIVFSDYTGDIKPQVLFSQISKSISELDESIKLYNSDTKAFLYEKENLVETFKLPSSDAPLKWKQVITEILEKSIFYSPILTKNQHSLENKIIIKITENLDEYSRIENNTNIQQNKMTYKFINNVLYVHSSLLYDGFSDYLKKIVTTHPTLEGIILDLRNTRGGDFNEALKTVDLFLDNSLITYRKTKSLPNKYYISSSGDIIRGKPIIILTNERTASSAEIVTAALQEQSRATLIGTKTFGKNSTQLTYQLDKQKIFITNGAFYTPSGKQISKIGILPKICTGLNNSCIHSDKNQPLKDIYLAIQMIKENFG